MPNQDILYRHQLSGDALRRMDALAVQVEHPHERIVYGRPVLVRPTFCRAMIGDGGLLLVVTALRTAPAYHAVLVDSSWGRPSRNHFDGSPVEIDLDDDERRDLIRDLLVDVCGDGDRWHEENGEEKATPPGLFCSDMGFSYGLEQLGTDGLLRDASLAA